jgi:hypothetical protein
MQTLRLIPLLAASAVSLVSANAFGQPTTVAPTGINGVINVQAYGAAGDGSTDDTQAIQLALQTAAGTGATVMLPPTPSNTWVISGQLKVPTKVVFEGQCGSGRGMGSADPIQGSKLLWKGADEVAIVHFHDVNRSTLRCMTIASGNPNLTNLIGILYDSDNNPLSSYNTFEKFYVQGTHIGFACGLTTNTPAYCVGDSLNYTGATTTGAAAFTGVTGGVGLVPAGTLVTQNGTKASTTTTSVVSLPAANLPVASTAGFQTPGGTLIVGPPVVAGCFEADTARIEDFGMIGTGIQSNNGNGDEGIHVNAANCLQGSIIEKGSFQGEHIAVHIVNTNGGLRLMSLNGGHTGADVSAAFLQFDPAVVASPDLWANETEGNFAYSVHDTACNSFAGSPGTPTWIGNQFNNPVAADGCERINSIGNEEGVGQMTASGTTQVVSINEARWGAALGQPVTCAGMAASEFTGCAGGNGFMRQGTQVTQPGNPAAPVTFTSQPVTLPAQVVSVESTSGFAPGATVYLGAPVVSTWNNSVLSTGFLGASGYVSDGCAGTSNLASGIATIKQVCLAGASVIGVAEITSTTPNALGWSLSGPTLTIRSASLADNSEIAWWRLK